MGNPCRCPIIRGTLSLISLRTMNYTIHNFTQQQNCFILSELNKQTPIHIYYKF